VAQPGLGIAASLLAIVISLGFISLFDFPSFAGDVTFYTLCLIPMQVMAVVLWGANPPFVARMAQPAKGLALLALTAAIAAIVFPLALAAAGEGVRPPGPIPAHFVIIAVPTTFYLCIIFGGWPFTAVSKNPVVAGFVTLIAAYLVTFAIFRLFFNYDFLQGAPVYLASAPKGMFMGVMAMVFYVTILAGMFVVIHFDLWPLTTQPGIMKQPVLGVVWLVISIVLAAIAFQIGVVGMGTDPMIFLTRVTVPFIFGTIIVLNMLQNSLFAKMAQPVKGVANVIAATVVGEVLAQVYGALAPVVTGALPSGPPGYEYEIWLANALLSVTFPFLIFLAAYFGFWPLARPAAAK
jgi:hypothetical protein